MGFLPICRRAASLPHPFGLFPTNTPVLDAVNGRKTRYCVTLVTETLTLPSRFFLGKEKSQPLV